MLFPSPPPSLIAMAQRTLVGLPSREHLPTYGDEYPDISPRSLLAFVSSMLFGDSAGDSRNDHAREVESVRETYHLSSTQLQSRDVAPARGVIPRPAPPGTPSATSRPGSAKDDAGCRPPHPDPPLPGSPALLPAFSLLAHPPSRLLAPSSAFSPSPRSSAFPPTRSSAFSPSRSSAFSPTAHPPSRLLAHPPSRLLAHPPSRLPAHPPSRLLAHPPLAFSLIRLLAYSPIRLLAYSPIRPRLLAHPPSRLLAHPPSRLLAHPLARSSALSPSSLIRLLFDSPIP